MSKIKTSVPSHLLSGALGGLIVALLSIGAYGAGLVDREVTRVTPAAGGSGSGTLVSQPVESSTVSQVFERVGPGVAYIEATSPNSDLATNRGGAATGSGFVIDDAGHIVTNAHVVDGADQVRVTLGEDGSPIEAEVLGADTSTDVAVLSIDPDATELTPLSFGDSSALSVGDPAIAIGNPFGLERTVTTGIVSALQREIEAPNGFTISDVIQTDASINPGNSGGPLLDAEGRVVGINSQIATGGGSGGSVGIGFAVSIGTAKAVIDQIIDGGDVAHAFLGVSGADLTPDLAEVLGLDISSGALVQDVVGEGPADQAGLRGGSAETDGDGVPARAGDVIVSVDGEAVNGFDDIIDIVNTSQPGDQLALVVLRDGEKLDLDVTLGDRPDQANS